MRRRNQIIALAIPRGRHRPAASLAGLVVALLAWPPTATAERPGYRQIRPQPAVNHISPQRRPVRVAQGQTTLRVAPRASAPEVDSLLLAPDLKEGSITSVTTNIMARGELMPENVAAEKMLELAAVSYNSVAVRQWGGLQYCWDAPVACHEPLYFEEVNLERHGYGPRHLHSIQPLLSGAQFFATVPALPYKIMAEPPSHPVYTLGRYRPGSPVPYRVNYPPLSLRGGVAEAGLAVGLVFLIP